MEFSTGKAARTFRVTHIHDRLQTDRMPVSQQRLHVGVLTLEAG